jgi:hypothetical protein
VLLEDRGLASHFSTTERDQLNGIWSRLEPWPDTVEGLRRLRQSYVTSTLSNAGMATMVSIVKRADLSIAAAGDWLPWPGEPLGSGGNARPDVRVVRRSVASLAPGRAAGWIALGRPRSIAGGGSKGRQQAPARRLLVQRSPSLPRRLPKQHSPGQRRHHLRRPPLLSPPPRTLHRQNRWKGTSKNPINQPRLPI